MRARRAAMFRPARASILAALCVAACAGVSSAEPPLTVDTDFAGGNIVVERIDGDDVYVRPDPRDTAGKWFYWCFRVRGAQGRTLTFHFTDSTPIGAHGPAASIDAGQSWQWLGAASVDGGSFRFAAPADAAEVRLCVAFSYVAADLQQFLAKHAGSRHVEVKMLCTTAKGRTVDLVRVGRLDGACGHRVAIACRHHACETMASYAVEGLIDAVLSDSRTGRWLREHVEFAIVPIVDADGVEDGDQGKNRRPYDHNRDYSGESIYPAVRAIRQWLPDWSQQKLRVALDLHCPGIRGQAHEAVHFVGLPSEAVWREVNRLGQALEQVQAGPLVFDRANDLPFGQGWNVAANFEGRKSFAQWTSEIDGVTAAATIEIPYANASGRTVTDETARAFGRDLASALRAYLE